MSLLVTSTSDNQLDQIQHLIQRFFGDFMTPSAADEAAQAFEQSYPLAQMHEWSEQVNPNPLWNSLLMAIRCGQLLQQQPRVRLGQIYGSEQTGAQLQHDFAGLGQEQLLLLCLGTKNQIVKRQVIFQGTLNACPVHPRELFQAALRTNTARVVIAHNHPSGDATPSKRDAAFTKRLQDCGELLGIPLLDSFVVGETDYFSFAEQGLLNCNIES
jgi:DNA repair protein RadC